MTSCCGHNWGVEVLRCLHCGSHLDKVKTPEIPEDEIIVKVQSMFPNCQKYDPCCTESGTEKMMKKFDKMNEKPIERISHKANKGNRIKIIKRVKPVKDSPFPDEAVEKW